MSEAGRGEAPYDRREWRLTHTADTVNTGLLGVLAIFYVGHRVYPHAVPGLDTVFPVIGATAFVVSMAAWGVERGLLPSAEGVGGVDE